MNSISGKFYSGMSGLLLPYPNKSFYPPEFQSGTRLSYYSSLFNSIEVNSSFYKLPRAVTVQKWAAEVPDNFRFTYKLWKDITHCKNLDFRSEDISQFMEALSFVGRKKGSLLVQFPPKLPLSTLSRLEELLYLIRENDPSSEWKLFVELRNSEWYNENLHSMLSRYSADLVKHDKVGAPGFIDPEIDAVYLRFHGPGGNYRGTYSDEFLFEYAQYILDWLAEGKTVFAYFNNTMGEAIGNCRSLNQHVADGMQINYPY